jgi:hypothetical protein
MIEPILSYCRLLRFKGPELAKRYYRIFGDLEYDLMSLKTESEVMSLKLKDLQRRLHIRVPINDEEEHRINSVAHEIAEPLYTRLDDMHARIRAARDFHYNSCREREGYYLLADIATAIMGVEDHAVRVRERETLTIACEAYGRLDLSALTDLHDGVQNFLSMQRREHLDTNEEQEWLVKLEELRRTPPLCYADCLNDADGISDRMRTLKNKIRREEKRLERLGIAYLAAVHTIRNLN